MISEPNIPDARRSWIRILAFPFILFLLGGAAIAWLLTQTETGRELIAPAPLVATPETLAKPEIPVVTPPPALPTPQLPLDMATRIASLEARIAQLEARGAGDGSSRADALFAVFSARRLLERGEPLGAVETELNSRFGTAHPRAVAAIASAARQPTSLAALTQQLRDLAPALSTNGDESDWWSQFTQGLSELIVVRDAREPNLDPATRIANAIRLLETGQVEAAITQISPLPRRAQATNWMAAARRHAEALNALDALDAAALAPPVALPPSPPRMIILPPAPAGDMPTL